MILYCNGMYAYHWRIRGAPPAPPPRPTGSISFVFVYVFTKKCMHRRLAPPNGSAPPNRKSWIRHCVCCMFVPGMHCIGLRLSTIEGQCAMDLTIHIRSWIAAHPVHLHTVHSEDVRFTRRLINEWI